jgi:thymidine kinase
MNKPGSLTVICGCMFAGKSEELVRQARRALYARKRIQVFKPTLDSRIDPTKVVSHAGARFEATAVKDVAELAALILPDTEMVFIDEVQFFEATLPELCMTLADGGVDIVCAGLDQDFRRQPFGPMAELLALADDIIKLHAICMKCGAPASHTYRSVNGRPAHHDDPVVLIGASERYEARCRRCYRLRKGKRRP